MTPKKILKSMEVTVNEKIISCIKIINNNHKQFVYVVNKEKKLIGILTDADVRRAILNKINLENNIKKIYNKKPKFVYEFNDLSSIDRVFKKTKVNFLPVVDKSKKIVDILEVHQHQKNMNLKKKNNSPNTLIIMAGGKGLRLRPLTKNNPKPLIKIDNTRSILEYNIDHFLDQGIKKIFILTHYLSHKISNKINKKKSYWKKITIIKEDKEMGTAGGIRLIDKKKIDLPAILVNGDIVSDISLESFYNFHNTNKNDLTVGLKQVSNQSSFGEVTIENLKIKNIEEKKIKTSFINAGIYCFGKNIFDIIKANKKKIDMDFLINEALKKRHKVGGYPIFEFWMDIGNKKNLDIIRNILKKK